MANSISIHAAWFRLRNTSHRLVGYNSLLLIFFSSSVFWSSLDAMTSTAQQVAYAQLDGKDSEDGFSMKPTAPRGWSAESKTVRYSVIITAVNSTLLVIWSVYSFFAGQVSLSAGGPRDTSWLLEQTSGYCESPMAMSSLRFTLDFYHLIDFEKQITHLIAAPVFDQYPVTLQPVYQNNTLFSDNVLRQRPSSATDAAWDDLARLSMLTLTADEVQKLGHRPAEVTHMPGDTTRFPAMLSMTHQLHCLNHIRKGLEADYYMPAQNRSRHDWEHLYHCLYFLPK